MKDLKNNTYKEIWDEINKYEYITLCTHIDADGDTIASAIALKHLIFLNSKIKDIKISGEKYPRYLDFLEKNDNVSNDFFNKSLKIVVDTSTPSRIFDNRVITQDSLKIDHHHHECEWKLEVGGDHWPATGQIIFEMIKELNLKSNKKVLEAIFVAIWTDTEGMTQRNINKITQEAMDNLEKFKNVTLEKMKLNEEELAIIESSNIKEKGKVTYSLQKTNIPNDIFRQYTNYVYEKAKTEIVLCCAFQNEIYRCELRSRGNIDVSFYAKKMNGGGHLSSSGFKIKSKDFDKCKAEVHNLIKIINLKNS